MQKLDLAGALAHLMGRVGARVAVGVGATDEDGAPLVAELVGTLRVVGSAYGDELPDATPAELPVVFGFEEHDSTFVIDVLAFRQAHAAPGHLQMEFGAIVIEIRPAADAEC